MAHAAPWSGEERRHGAYDQRLWREERRRDSASASEDERGGWRAIASRVKDQVREDRLSVIAPGVAFYALLAVFPALTAVVAIYGLVADPQQVGQQVAALSSILPPAAAHIIDGQLRDLVRTDHTALGLGAVVSILVALWSSSQAVRTLMKALNVVYDEDESRGTLRFYATAIALTVGAILGAVVLIGIIVAIPVAARFLGLGQTLAGVIDFVRWPLVAVAMIVALTVAYRYGPSRSAPGWKWTSWGAAIATALWVAGSALFSLYVTRFGHYNKTYGSIGAVVILLTWFLLSAYAVLIGAEIDAVMESRRRSTRAAR